MSEEPIVDLAMLETTRALLGSAFVRVLGYFHEDGGKAVGEIEAGYHAGSAAAIVRPAHTLKTEARQFGATALGELASAIEAGARRCVEIQEDPAELLVPVAKLRPLFNDTVAALERETNPLREREPKRRRAS